MKHFLISKRNGEFSVRELSKPPSRVIGAVVVIERETAPAPEELKDLFAANLKPPIPDSVSFGQAHAAMRLTPHGEGTVLDQVETIIDQARLSALPEHVILTSFWDAKSDFYRDSPSVLSLSSQIGLTPAQVDDLFRLAASFNV